MTDTTRTVLACLLVAAFAIWLTFGGKERTDAKR